MSTVIRAVRLMRGRCRWASLGTEGQEGDWCVPGTESRVCQEYRGRGEWTKVWRQVGARSCPGQPSRWGGPSDQLPRPQASTSSLGKDSGFCSVSWEGRSWKCFKHGNKSDLIFRRQHWGCCGLQRSTCNCLPLSLFPPGLNFCGWRL